MFIMWYRMFGKGHVSRGP